MKDIRYQIFDNGDAAFTIVIDQTISEQLSIKLISIGNVLAGKMKGKLSEIIPAYQSITLCFDPLENDRQLIKLQIIKILAEIDTDLTGQVINLQGRLIEVPVCYEKDFAPDLSEVASHCKITEEEVVQLHSNKEYLVHMLGFLPGFLYLGGLDKNLFCPRKNKPRTQVEAGSVGIGGKQTGIYPVASPGGWQIIGRSPINLFTPNNDYPAIASPLDRIRFVAINRDQFETIQNQQKQNNQSKSK